MRGTYFRAFIKPLGRYASGIDTIQFHKCCDVAGAGIWAVVTANEGIYEGDDIIIEQDTGIKDKNGKEIYEGDIVTFMIELFDSVTLGLEIEEWHTAVVEWSQDDACYSFVDGDDPFSVQFEAEVIGNIHENPELLEYKG